MPLPSPLRRALKALGLAAALLLLAVALLLAWTFAGLPPIPDGQVYGPAQIAKDGYVSAAILDLGGGEVALVDAGNDPEAEALRAALAARGLEGGAVKAILLTHAHPDHTAGCAAFPQAEVYAAAAEAPLLAGEARARGPLPRLFPPPEVPPCRLTRGLQDGEQLALGRLKLTLYAVPGHTAGSAAWLADDGATRVLLLGDSADATPDGAMVGAKWLFTDDPDQNRASLQALARRLPPGSADALVFSHTGALDGDAALQAWR